MRCWDVTVYDQSQAGATVHGLSQAQMSALIEIFDRSGIPAKAIEYDENHQPTGSEETANLEEK